MNTAGQPKYSSSIDCGRKLLREGGLRNLYRGTVATLLRGNTHTHTPTLITFPTDLPGSAFYFGGYEWTLRYLTPVGRRYTHTHTSGV